MHSRRNKAPTFEHSVAVQALGNRVRYSGTGPESCCGLQQSSGQQRTQWGPLETSTIKPKRSGNQHTLQITSKSNFKSVCKKYSLWQTHLIMRITRRKYGCQTVCGWVPWWMRRVTPPVALVCSDWVVTETRTFRARQQQLSGRMRQIEVLPVLHIVGDLLRRTLTNVSLFIYIMGRKLWGCKNEKGSIFVSDDVQHFKKNTKSSQEQKKGNDFRASS